MCCSLLPSQIFKIVYSSRS